MAHLMAFGVTHRSAPLWLLESVTRVRDAAQVAELGRAQLGVDGCVVLSTCNRFEVYLRADRLLGRDEVALLLADAADLPLDRLRPHLHIWVDEDAVHHAFAVAAGLDSRVVGEEEILGQVRTAVATAADRGTLHPELAGLFHWANRAARRSRAVGGFHAVHRSVAQHAVEVGQRLVGGLGGRRVVLVGAGQIAARAARTLLDRGAVVEAVTRAPGRSRTGWPQVPVRPLADLSAVLADADLVLCAATTTDPVVTVETVRRARTGGSSGELCVIDVSVPRTVDVDLADEPGVTVLDLDDLARYQDPTPADTRVRAAERVVREEAEQFLHWRRSRAAAPYIQRLQAAAASICAASVRRAKADSVMGQAAVVRATGQVAAALLHGPIVAVREAVAAGDLAAAERVVALFERGVGDAAASDPPLPTPRLSAAG